MSLPRPAQRETLLTPSARAVLGLYVLKEDLHLATPPPHPSEAPVLNPNPLSTNPQPATTGTKLSLINLDLRPLPPAFYKVTSRTSGGIHPSIQEHPNESQSSAEIRESSERWTCKLQRCAIAHEQCAGFRRGNTLLTPANLKDANKRKKPKNNMTKSNSSFISRVIVHEALNKRLQERPSDGLYAFANINKGLPMARSLFCDKGAKARRTAVTERFSRRGKLTCWLTGRIFDQDPIYQGSLSLPMSTGLPRALRISMSSWDSPRERSSGGSPFHRDIHGSTRT